MLHSAIISEPAAWVGGVLVGWAGAAVAHALGASPPQSLAVGSVAAVVTSVAVGAPINAMTFDVLSLLVLRPLTGWGVWEVAGRIARATIG